MSAWSNGVKEYANELKAEIVEGIERGEYDADIWESPNLLRKALLNGASDWSEYSMGGCSLWNDQDIAERLAPPSARNRIRPNGYESWLDVQARALSQAARIVMSGS